MNNKKQLIERTQGLYMCDNLLLYPGQLGVIKLSFPRCFVRYNNDFDTFFASFEDWAKNLTVTEWLDPTDKPTTENEVIEILADIWNFICLQEEEEERLAEEREIENF